MQRLPTSTRTTPAFTATWDVLLALSRSELFSLSSSSSSFIEHFRALDDAFVAGQLPLPCHSITPENPWLLPPFLDVLDLQKKELDWDTVLNQQDSLQNLQTTHETAAGVRQLPQHPRTETVVFDVLASWFADGRCDTHTGDLNLKQAAYLLLIGVWLQNQLNEAWGFPCSTQTFQNSLLIGGPGSGKTYVTNLVKELVSLFFPASTCQAAYTHRASRLVGGTTLHSCLGLQVDQGASQCYQSLGNRKESLQAFWHEVRSFFIDEASMVSKELLAEVEHRCRLVKANPSPWGNLSVRLSGCFHQLPPIAASSLIQPLPPPPLEDLKPQTVAGHELWSSITTVIHLDVSRRCQGDLHTFLNDLLTDKGVSDASWDLLLKQCLRPKDPRLQLPQFAPDACPVGVLRHSVRACKNLQRAHEAAFASGHRLVLAVAADRQASATKAMALDPGLALQAAGVHTLSVTMNLPGILCLYPGVSLCLEAKLCSELGLVRGCVVSLDKITFADAEPSLGHKLSNKIFPVLCFLLFPCTSSCLLQRPFDTDAALPPHPLLFTPAALILHVLGATWIKHPSLGPGRFYLAMQFVLGDSIQADFHGKTVRFCFLLIHFFLTFFTSHPPFQP